MSRNQFHISEVPSNHQGDDACADPEDDSRITDRGWVVRRGLVPQKVLEELVAYFQTIPQPERSTCGTSNLHPAGRCMPDVARFPRLLRRLEGMTEGWISSGLHDVAGLGWPLRPLPGEFLPVARWRRRSGVTPRCIFQALFLASHARSDPTRRRCLRAVCKGASSNERCDRASLDCWLQSVLRLPRDEVKRIVASPECTLPRSSQKSSGRLALISRTQWPFDEEGHAADLQSSRLCPAELSTWLTVTLNDTAAFQSAGQFHTWHQDGPHQLGRTHKAWLLVSKNSSTARGEHCAGRSNLMVISDAKLRATIRPTDFERVPRIERLGCKLQLTPGDMLFFREDVVHRTQDLECDRLAFSVPILRFPLQPGAALRNANR